MAYEPTIWVDGENKYHIKDQEGNIIYENIKLEYAGDGGTPVNAGNMNNIESGIEDSYIAAMYSASNLPILVRDILKMKMRQTGLNLDPNAWSDTLEDTSGINTSLSSNYVLDGVNKSLKANNAYTQSSGPSGGQYRFNVEGTKFAQSFKVSTTSPIVGAKIRTFTTVGAASVANFRLETDNAGKPSGTLCGANTKKDSVNIPNTNSYDVEVLFDAQFTPTIGTTYWLVWEQVSGGNTSFLGGNNGGYANGSVARYSGGTWTIDGSYDFYFGIRQGGDGTVIWNSVASDGTINKGIIESVQSGTVTFYLSRDGGTTFTPCTVDTVTDLTSQPTGTSVVLKAVISGNAELFAVAWGGTVS